MKTCFSSRLTLGFALVALCSVIVVGCGAKSDDNGGSKTPVDPYTLTNDETSDATGDDVRSFVNGESLLATMSLSSLLSLSSEVPAISRSAASDFQTCVKKRINDIPLRVTSDTLSISYDIDFIAACDRLAKPEDTITEIANHVSGRFVLTCGGAGFMSWDGKTIGDLGNNSLETSCTNARVIQFASSIDVAARKLSKTKAADGTDVTTLVVTNVRNSLTAPDGSPCGLLYDNKTYTLDSCRKVSTSRSFTGDPQFEKASPKATGTVHPIVNQSEVMLGEMAFLSGDRYYKAGTATFRFNGWAGQVHYTNGWAAPRWDAALNAQKVDGVLGEKAVVPVNNENDGRSRTTDQPEPPVTPGEEPVYPNN